MVLQKRLYYGFNGYQAPPITRGTRSARGKRFVRKKVEENQLCPFELLAAVAGKLLLEKEAARLLDPHVGESNPPTVSNSVKQEQRDELKSFNVEPCDQGSCDEGKVTYEVCRQRPSSKFVLKKHTQVFNSVIPDPVSVVKSDQSDKIGYPKEVAFDKSVSGITVSSGTDYGECYAHRQSPCYAESNVTRVEGESRLQTMHERTGNGMDGSTTDLLCSEDLMELDSKLPTLVSSDIIAELPPYGKNYLPSSSFTKNHVHRELFDKDDDENSSRCSQPRISKSSKPQRVGDRRIRKLLASKFWKVGPTLLKGVELSNNDTGIKPFHSRKMCYTRQRTQRYSFKRKRLSEHRSMSVSCSEISNEAISKSFEVRVNKDEHDRAASFHGALNSEECQVKLNIKTIKLPEFFIDMPESETIGALKRIVLEAVNSILKNGFRVGVSLQGKKVPDDAKTLRQAGICNEAKLENLGFSLERNLPESTLPPTNNEDYHFPDACDSSKPLSWLPAVPAGDSVTSSSSDHLVNSVTASAHQAEKDFSSSPADMSLEDKTTTNSKALAVVPAMSMETLAVVPLHHKSRGSDVVQRRIRRPFSVVEVEALVQAVETLGTGRWRDVKLQAFENAKHRTYVDLKDKWKTLVHTARISPQQRRGEPVPQELLDRVLAAHAYWSQQQAKLHNKLQQLEQPLLA